MSIQGAVAAAVRNNGPWSREIGLGAQLIVDFQGSRTGAPYYWYKGTRYTSPDRIPGWSFSRASAGYAETKDGRLVAFGAGEPRITDRGLLIEEARTNLLQRSQEMDASVWGKLDLTVTPDLAVAPDGTLTAEELVGASSDSRLTQAITPTASTAYVASIWLRVPSGTLSTNIYLTQSGVGVIGSTAVTVTTAWKRFIVTATPGSTNSMSFQIGGGNTIGVGTTLQAWGAQVEAGAFVTSYIQTTTAAATRAADNASITGLSTILGQFRTNWIPNSSMVGAAVGSPGTLPTGWTVASAVGLTTTVVGVGNDASGAPYIDVWIAGTANVTGNYDLRINGGGTAPAALGQVWVGSLSTALIAGVAPPGAKLAVWGALANATWVEGAVAPVNSSPVLTRVSAARTMANASTVGANMLFEIAVTNGEVIDATYRIAAPQLERDVLTAWIPTTTAAASAGNPVTLVAWADLPAADGTDRELSAVSDGTFNNRTDIRRAASNRIAAITTSGGVGQTGVSSVATFTGAASLKAASRVRSANVTLATNNATPSGTSITPPLNLSRLDFGSILSNNYLNGYLQRVLVLGDTPDEQLSRLSA